MNILLRHGANPTLLSNDRPTKLTPLGLFDHIKQRSRPYFTEMTPPIIKTVKSNYDETQQRITEMKKDLNERIQQYNVMINTRINNTEAAFQKQISELKSEKNKLVSEQLVIKEIKDMEVCVQMVEDTITTQMQKHKGAGGVEDERILAVIEKTLKEFPIPGISAGSKLTMWDIKISYPAKIMLLKEKGIDGYIEYKMEALNELNKIKRDQEASFTEAKKSIKELNDKSIKILDDVMSKKAKQDQMEDDLMKLRKLLADAEEDWASQRPKKRAKKKKRTNTDFIDYMAEVVREGRHQWPEVTDFCQDAKGDPQWKDVTSVTSMKARITINGWSSTDGNVGEAAMNTWYAFKGLKRMSER